MLKDAEVFLSHANQSKTVGIGTTNSAGRTLPACMNDDDGDACVDGQAL